jgi:predicted transcriptional regulator of viral defense system
MTYRDPHDAIRALHGLATAQGGYFTAKQAASVGYDYPHLAYHLKAGNFERAGHGLYRIVTIPVADHDDLIRLHLWSRDRHDAPAAVVSHASALFLHQLSDVLPRQTHLTVPPGFRKALPKGCVLHKAVLSGTEIEPREGFAVTTPLRTLLDCATDTSVSEEQLAKAVEDATARGMVRPSKLQEAVKRTPAASRLLRIPA